MIILSYHNVKVPHTSAHSLLTMQTSMDLSSIADVYYYANCGGSFSEFRNIYGFKPEEHPYLHLRITRNSHKSLASIEKRGMAIKDIVSHRRDKKAVYVTQIKPLRFFLALKKIGLKIKIIVEPHSETERWDKKSLANVDGIIFTTQSLRSRLTDRYSISPDIPSRVFYHRVRIPIIDHIPVRKTAKEGFCIGYIGGLEKWKGVDTIIGAMSLLPEDICARFVGGKIGGMDHDRLLSLAEKRGISSRVFFAGRVKQDELASTAGDVDLFVLPLLDSGQGSLPMKLFDYMRLGRPIVAAAQDSLKEVLDEGSALFYDAGSPGSLAAQVLRLYGDADLCCNLATKALDDIKSYSVDKWREDMKGLFSEMGLTN
jgi:glycosyltransferase involved in cell wall biosynthesis